MSDDTLTVTEHQIELAYNAGVAHATAEILLDVNTFNVETMTDPSDIEDLSFRITGIKHHPDADVLGDRYYDGYILRWVDNNGN